jgi:hypothetical protein
MKQEHPGNYTAKLPADYCTAYTTCTTRVLCSHTRTQTTHLRCVYSNVYIIYVIYMYEVLCILFHRPRTCVSQRNCFSLLQQQQQRSESLVIVCYKCVKRTLLLLLLLLLLLCSRWILYTFYTHTHTHARARAQSSIIFIIIIVVVIFFLLLLFFFFLTPSTYVSTCIIHWLLLTLWCAPNGPPRVCRLTSVITLLTL